MAHSALLPDQPLVITGDPALDSAVLLDALVRGVYADPSEDRLWLLFVAVATAFPTAEELVALRRQFELTSPVEASVALLKAGFAVAASCGSPESDMRLVSDTVLVDVDFSAQHELHTGIQRVVRSTIPHWAADRPVTFAAWTSGYGAYRELRQPELDRVANWGDVSSPTRTALVQQLPTLLVPWHTAVVLAEVPDRSACSRLAALAQFSNNELAAIGYDCIPIVSADLLPPVEPNRFVHYLAALKYAHSIAGISASATAEFAGFSSMLPAQGLAGPTVFECGLPAPAATPFAAEPTDRLTAGGRPIVACVGSFEPRKNQIAVLHAAEMLWREGLNFELVLIGGGGSSAQLKKRVGQLRRQGRAVSTRTGISEAQLTETYRQARFTVFPSLHEGYGLPVVESLAQATPVLTTDYGSPAEIGESGGTLLVDPRTDRAIADGMRTLLTNDDVLNKLIDQIGLRPARSWQDYADELWAALVQPALDRAARVQPALDRAALEQPARDRAALAQPALGTSR